ncbi:MAG: SemiSWEET family transporter [Candidatus Omnitrophota bacterium]|jgi:MtN3 and saliva related transmembrane protein
MLWKSIGMLAAMLTMFGFVPQIFKMVRTRSSRDVSIISLFQFSTGVFLWFLYGIYLKDAIIMCANLVTLLSLIAAMIFYFKYSSESKTH